MIREFAGRIKVPNKIKPLPRAMRTVPDLVKRRAYYICFGNNNVYSCRIAKVLREFDKAEVIVKIRVKPTYDKFKRNGITVYDPYEERLVYADEIGTTPEAAVDNMV